MLWMRSFLGIAAVSLLTGCISLQVGARSGPSRLQMDGLANGYASVTGIRPWDGVILQAHLLDGDGPGGELASLEVWPLVEVGVGVIGARVQLGPVAAGVGALCYEPRPSYSGAGQGVEEVTTTDRDAEKNEVKPSSDRADN